MANLIDGAPAAGGTEQFTELLARPGARIERIVSMGQATPPGEWLDQAWDEWVLLVDGAARLVIDGEDELSLARGDYVLIPARARHRVEWTDPLRPTIWLAVHCGQR